MIRVAVVDDQELIRTGLSMVIESQDDMQVVVQAADGIDALDKLRVSAVDVVVMDVRMPRMDGVQATARLQELDPAPKVLILTTFDIDQYALDALRAGASGFLLKESRGEQIVEAIRHIVSGDAVIAPSTTRRLLDGLVDSADKSGRAEQLMKLLTRREAEVFRSIASGKSNAEIATDLYLSQTTVKSHVRAILRKVGARDRIQLVIAAYEAGLV